MNPGTVLTDVVRTHGTVDNAVTAVGWVSLSVQPGEPVAVMGA